MEAGVDEPYVSDVTLLFSTLQQSNIDWKFQTEPSPYFCKAMTGGRCNWPRGKSLGGSSVINAMMHVRGNKNDYDEWESFGNTGWAYDDVLPYFKKLETVNITGIKDNPSRGTSGPIFVEHARYPTLMSDVFLEAASEVGFVSSTNNDYNAGDQLGFWRVQNSIKDGLRCSTSKGYLRPRASNLNIHFSMASHVEKILINPITKVAYGVRFKKDGISYDVKASKEVILSAGAIQSPQLLKLSGVGPTAELLSFNIPVIHDSPGVGENLQDHIGVGGESYLVTNPNSSELMTITSLDAVTVDSVNSFIFNKDGKLYASPFGEVTGFINTKYQDPALSRPDIQVIMSATTDTADGGVFSQQCSGISTNYYNTVYEPFNYNDAFSMWPLLLRPKSRGQILLRDGSSYSNPLIYPNYFADSRDLDTLVSRKISS